MSCPICKRLYCDHSPQERGQTENEMLEDMMAPHIIDKNGNTLRVSYERYKKETGREWPQYKGDK